MSGVICILGMHRSGTSSLAGSLEEAGLHLGKIIKKAPNNAKGNRENKRIMDLQDELLAYNGGSWRSPPENVVWTDAHRAARDAILASYKRRDLWGFKDPRTLLTLRFWQEALPRMTFVATFRHPLLVAESLIRRNGGDRERWLALWAEYNQRLLALHAHYGFEVLSFDGPEGAYRSALRRVALALGLSPPQQLRFFDPRLRHHVAHPLEAMPERVQAIYDALNRIAGVSVTGSDAPDARFEQTRPARRRGFSPIDRHRDDG